MKNFATTIFIIVLTVFTSCKTAKATMPGEILTNTTWQLSQMNGNNIDASAYSRGLPYLSFTKDNKVSGNSGCNGFSAAYNINDTEGMNISRIVSTKMYCEGVNESEFFSTLEKVTMSKTEKDKLTLFNGTDEVLVFVPKQ